MNPLIIKTLNTLNLLDFAVDKATNYLSKCDKNWHNMRIDGKLPLPTYMSLTPTKKCNLNCIQCHQKGIKNKTVNDLSLEQIKQVIDNSGNIKICSTIGGEIFVRKDMMDILKYLDYKNINIKISTNGYNISDELLHDIYHDIKNVSNVAVSIDGPSMIHNSIRGKSDAFEQSIKTMKFFKEIAGYKVLACSVLLPENIDYIFSTLFTFFNLNVDRVTLIPAMYKDSSDIKSVQKITDCDNINLQEKPKGYSPISQAELREIKKIVTYYRSKGLFVIFTPHLDKIDNYSYFNYNKQNYLCKQMFLLHVDELGNIGSCPFINKTFGNLLEKPITEIWNSKEYCDFRKRFYENSFSFCHRCCASRKVKSC